MAKQKNATTLVELQENILDSPEPIAEQSAETSSAESVSALEAGYTKQQFLGSAKYAAYKDVLNALLEDEETYTTEQINHLLKEFLQKEAE
ncbi:hypothetical protein [Paenibacillus naphthalenovorans]|uniref:hypothetical protein n=1 Tax=Paenibacillus naphthalenovorans TaxID=162209 RepID=UPI000891969B|nr:hypothetical protein [Paenibacillus naphthalenovorans]SDJ76445.1 hypothetical protein SAMN05421868_14321 [Paenibacillus naphthalenovorans]